MGKYKHGQGRRGHKHPLTRVWSMMKTRCYNHNFHQYTDYGGRGIRVCETWMQSFKQFFDWAIASGWERGLTIDRINCDGDYSPDNCRFVTRTENNRNKRNKKLTVAQVIEMRDRHAQGETSRHLSIVYNISVNYAYKIIGRQVWKDTT